MSFAMLLNAPMEGMPCSTPRAAMLLEFDSVVGVHFDHMPREDFRKTIDANWNWLDGRSLI